MTHLNIRWLNKALINLNHEAQYIATDSPIAAKIMVQKIRATVELLANNPSLGRPGRIVGTRELINPWRMLVSLMYELGHVELNPRYHSWLYHLCQNLGRLS